MTFKAVVFDLDDTLYNESVFVESGFSAVARYLFEINSKAVTQNDILSYMFNMLSSRGRGRVFNDVLAWLKLPEEKYLSTLIYIYRNQIPNGIELYPEMEELLKRLLSKKIKLGIITDGVYVAQKNKTDILLKDLPFSCIIHTDSLGQNCWKPSSEPFKVAVNLLNIKPSEAVYIGDNPMKDFKGARSINMKTIWWNPNNIKYDFIDTYSIPDVSAYNIEELKQLLYL